MEVKLKTNKAGKVRTYVDEGLIKFAIEILKKEDPILLNEMLDDSNRGVSKVFNYVMKQIIEKCVNEKGL